MQSDLQMTFDHDVVCSELFFKKGIGAFCGSHDFVTFRFMVRHWYNIFTMGFPLYDRYMPKLAAILFD
jgi:hypothetical protein